MGEEERTTWDRLRGLLRNFWVNVAAVALGVLLALISPDAGRHLVPAGDLYLSFLTMSILPIVFSAIINGLGKLLRSGKAKEYTLRLVVIFAIAIVLGAAVGVLGGILGRPGSSLDGDQQTMVGKFLLQGPTEGSTELKQERGFIHLCKGVIPRNIFAAFADGRSLGVIFVSILMGLALGLNRSEASGRLLEVMEGVYETFFKILNWALYGLPLGLFCLMAGHIATIGTQYLVSLSKITAIVYLCCIFMGLMYLTAMRMVPGLPMGKMFRALRDPLALAFISSNTLVAMPMALRHLEDDLHQPHDLVRLVVPLGVVMNRHAYPLLFGFMTVYVSQVYDNPLGIFQLLQVCVASAMIGMAAIGPAASVAPLLTLILLPFGLPSELAVATLVETTALITPIVAMPHLFGSCATATLIGAKRSNRNSESPAA